MRERKSQTKRHKNGTLDRYFYTKTWVKIPSKNSLDIDEVNHRLYNDLPLDDLLNSKPRKNKNNEGK